MGAASRKFLSEFALNLPSARWLLITPTELVSGKEYDAEHLAVSNKCHIYLICRKPSASYDSKNFSFDGSRVKGKLL